MDLQAGDLVRSAQNGLVGVAVKQVDALFQTQIALLGGGLRGVLLQADHVDGLAHADQSTGGVESHVAAADDAHGVAQLDGLVQTLRLQDLQSGVDLLEVGAGQVHQLLAHAGADGDQNGVVVLLQLGGVLDLAVAHNLHAGVLNDLDLSQHVLGGDAVLGHTGGHVAAGNALGLEDGDIVALLIQIVAGSHAAAAGADDGNLLAGAGSHGQILLLPAPSLVMLGGITLQVADGHGAVQLVALTAALTAVVAHITQGVGEGHLLADDAHSLVAVAFLDGADVGGDVDVGGALGLTGDQSLLTLLADELQLVADGTGGAHLGAGGAEAAVGVVEQLVVQGAHVGLQTLLLIIQNAHTAQVAAGAHAAAAQHAAVHVVDEQGVALVHLHALGAGTHTGVVGADVLNEGLQLAVAVLGAGGAVLGVTAQQQLQSQGAQLAQTLALGADDQTVLGLQQAGLGDALLTVHFHHAQTAGAVLGQVGVMAQVGDVNTGVQSAVQNVFAVGHVQLDAVDGNQSHGVPSSLVCCYRV